MSQSETHEAHTTGVRDREGRGEGADSENPRQLPWAVQLPALAKLVSRRPWAQLGGLGFIHGASFVGVRQRVKESKVHQPCHSPICP